MAAWAAAVACNDRGLVKINLGDARGAVADFNQALPLAIHPPLAEAYNKRGNEKAKRNDPRGAIADDSKALAINPNNATTHRHRGFAFTNMDEPTECLQGLARRCDPG